MENQQSERRRIPGATVTLVVDPAQEIQAAVLAERERCCKIVYGHCASDNEAERIVRAIRGTRTTTKIKE